MGMSYFYEIIERGVKGNYINSNNGWCGEEIDLLKVIKCIFKLDYFFFVDFGSDIEDEILEWIFIWSKDYLVFDMKEFIGNGFENILLNGLFVIWIKVVLIDLKKFKGFSVFKYDVVFEYYYWVKYFDGSGEYIKRIVVIYKNNLVLIFYNGVFVENVYD